MKKPKTAREKLHIEHLPQVVDDRRGRGKMLIPKPLDVEALIRTIPEGKLTTITQIRERLAQDHHADFTCPLTTGIFLRIAAEAAEEDRASGKEEIAPYWRVIREDGSLNDKFPGGTEAQATHLREEGHSILPGTGRKLPRLQDFERSLQGL